MTDIAIGRAVPPPLHWGYLWSATQNLSAEVCDGSCLTQPEILTLVIVTVIHIAVLTLTDKKTQLSCKLPERTLTHYLDVLFWVLFTVPFY
jgi:hypothetical protein